MSRVTGFLLLALLAGSLAIPAPEIDQQEDAENFALPEPELEELDLEEQAPHDHDSDLFIHTDGDTRIVGGSTAPEGSVPYQVAMSNGNIRSYICGGSIISRRTVLTAAHCIAAVVSGGSLSSTLRVHVGTNRWNSGGQTLSLTRHVNHPSYNAATIKNDLGVLITASNINFNTRTAAVVLHTAWVGANVQSRVAGWGRTSAGGALSQNLLELRMPTIDGNRCASEVDRVARSLNLRVPAVNNNLEICTFLATNRGTCNGDSGSPLVRTNNNQQIGIVSWGIPCARGAPDMFVRVSTFVSWIRSNTVN